VHLDAGEPLSANDRQGWHAKAESVRTWRRNATLRARLEGVPRLERARVRLHVVPPTRRKRDPSNLMPTQKAVLDGLVAAGVLVDDDPSHVVEEIPLVHDATSNETHRMLKRWLAWVEIEELD
jgi:crossover junction endodeoxyribonuclease RusA